MMNNRVDTWKLMPICYTCASIQYLEGESMMGAQGASVSVAML